LDLPDSSIVADTMYGFAVVAASRKPKMFVLPSDPDFVRILNDPSTRGAKYLLAVPPTGRGQSDTLNKRYPTLYDTGADIATLEVEVPNDGDGQPDWRLYRVNEPR
ncbi:MAG: ABC transporter, partial [Mycobacterium sp.]